MPAPFGGSFMAHLAVTVLIAFCLSIVGADLAAATPPKAHERQILQEIVKLYESSKTPRAFYDKLYPSQDAKLMAIAIGKKFDEPSPKLSYDLEKMELGFKGFKMRFIDMSAGDIEINGRRIKYDRTLPMIDLMKSIHEQYVAKEKSAAWRAALVAKAAAEDTDFPRIGIPRGSADPLIDPVTHGCMMVVPETTLQSAAGAAGLWGAVAWPPVAAVLLGHYGMKKAHAYVLGASCGDQINQLMRIMNEGGIGLSRLNCSQMMLAGIAPVPLANGQHTIDFWTRQGDKVRMYTDFLLQRACVSDQEIYSFNRTKLTSVDTPKRDITAKSPEFDKYKAKIEPYRKVMEVIGSNESCFKCEKDINRFLARSKPGRYPITADTPKPLAPGTAQE